MASPCYGQPIRLLKHPSVGGIDLAILLKGSWQYNGHVVSSNPPVSLFEGTLQMF